METQSTSHGATRERSETKPDHSRQYSEGLGFRGLSDTHWSVKNPLVSSRGPRRQEVVATDWL